MRANLLCLLLAAGCSIPSTTFQPSADAGGSDGPSSDVLSIVPSATALTLDEGSTTEFTVQLSQPPAAPLTVQLESLSAAIAVTTPDLTFDATNYALPRTLLVTGIADPNIADANADIVLTATSLSPVTVVARVEDPDVVALVTSIGPNNIVDINAGQSVDVRVRLSHQPDGDATVVAQLGQGPCTAESGETRVFTPQNYDTDQIFRFKANPDTNTTNDDQSLRLRINTAVPVDRQFTLREIDPDVLNFVVTPSALTVTEQGAEGNLEVSLTKAPAGTLTVNVAAIAQSGAVTVDKDQLTFTQSNFATKQIVKVGGSADANVVDGTAVVRFTATGVSTRDVTINIDDNDVQQIQHNAGAAVGVAENGESQFGVRLAHEPSGNVTVAVQSQATGVATVVAGSTLTFTPQNYDTFQTVRVRGTDDNNLAANATTIRMFVDTLLTEVTVNVTDDDQQELLVSASTLSVAEGTTATFGVSLRFQPLANVTVAIASSNSTALPASPATLTFTTANFGTAQTVTVAPPLDNNNVSETSTITVSGGGAAQSKSIAATATDGTVIQTWGFPPNPPFPTTVTIVAGDVFAYKINVGAVANVATLHTLVPQPPQPGPEGPPRFHMALYTVNADDKPGSLVAALGGPIALVPGVNDGPAFNTPLLTQSSYFLAIRFEENTQIARATAAMTGRQCVRDSTISSIENQWPMTFGSASCEPQPQPLMQMWITTFHQ